MKKVDNSANQMDANAKRFVTTTRDGIVVIPAFFTFIYFLYSHVVLLADTGHII